MHLKAESGCVSGAVLLRQKALASMCLGLAVVLGLVAAPLGAQGGLVVTNSQTADALAQLIIGTDSAQIVPGTANLIGDGNCTGVFTGGLSAGLGIESGVIVGSGSVFDAVGPNDSDFTSTTFATPGDNQLATLVPQANTTDACVLEFEVTCPYDGYLNTTYQFGSEEFNDFVGFGFNDVFGFFLDGTNIALLPDGTTVVSINSVNGGSEFLGTCTNGVDDDGDGLTDFADSDCTTPEDNIIGEDNSNSQFFTNNDCSTPDGAAVPCALNIEADGLIDPLVASGAITAGVPAMFRIGVTDVVDGRLDSWVFIEEDSIHCSAFECPRTPGYWKNHPENWPVDSLELGGVVYDQATLMGFLNYLDVDDDDNMDMSMKLARQLTATKLSLLNGSDPSIQAVVDAADDFLTIYPPGSDPQGQAKDDGELLKDLLDDYNNIESGCISSH